MNIVIMLLLPSLWVMNSFLGHPYISTTVTAIIILCYIGIVFYEKKQNNQELSIVKKILFGMIIFLLVTLVIALGFFGLFYFPDSNFDFYPSH